MKTQITLHCNIRIEKIKTKNSNSTRVVLLLAQLKPIYNIENNVEEEDLLNIALTYILFCVVSISYCWHYTDYSVLHTCQPI